MLVFDEQYYQRVIAEHGYNHFEFNPINFNLRELREEFLKRKWLCHVDGDRFAEGLHSGGSCIVTTGFGLSGAPHIGTISQMLGAILLQQAGLKVQVVLGDLDAYNARKQPLSLVAERAEQYAAFITSLGFDRSQGILRNQLDHLEVLLTAYLSASCLTDLDFAKTEEDISALYVQKGIYPGIEFPVKQAILLMAADFIDLGKEHTHVLVMLGLDEHKYIQLARKVVERQELSVSVAGMYSRLNRGFNGYPKMSKSIPGSAITVDMSADAIKNLIMNGEGEYQTPMDSIVYQMMCSTSYYSGEELDALFQLCAAGGAGWAESKSSYADVVIDICRRWPR